jgi:hypothetical protein
VVVVAKRRKTMIDKSYFNQFMGTDNWYRHHLMRTFLYTDGIQYVCEEGEAYWLLDFIVSHQRNPKIRGERFQVWEVTRLDKDDVGVTISCKDDNKNVVFSEEMPYSDFPIDITIWVVDDGDHKVAMLPSEY